MKKYTYEIISFKCIQCSEIQFLCIVLQYFEISIKYYFMGSKIGLSSKKKKKGKENLKLFLTVVGDKIKHQCLMFQKLNK